MIHSSLSFPTFKVTDADPSSGIGTGAVLLVVIAREGSKHDGAAEVEGWELSEGLEDVDGLEEVI